MTSLVFLQQGKVKKSKNSLKLANIDRENLHNSWSTWGSGNFNETFRKDVAYGNIKSYKKAGFHSLSAKHIFEKP